MDIVIESSFVTVRFIITKGYPLGGWDHSISLGDEFSIENFDPQLLIKRAKDDGEFGEILECDYFIFDGEPRDGKVIWSSTGCDHVGRKLKTM